LNPAFLALGAGLLLAYAGDLTAAPGEQPADAERMRAVVKVLPAHDNDPHKDRQEADYRGRHWTFYVARKQGEFVGAAFETSSSKGYGGKITILVGVNAGGKVNGIEILEHTETPSLGGRMQRPEFTARFAGRSIRETDWRVRKDGGDIDEITSATISSRAVLEAVRSGLDAYIAHSSVLRSAAKTAGNP
jgi:electron transport complex protein RnfG